MATTTVECTWKSRTEVEIPEGVDPYEFRQAINACDDSKGYLVAALEECDARGAELVDWSAP